MNSTYASTKKNAVAAPSTASATPAANESSCSGSRAAAAVPAASLEKPSDCSQSSTPCAVACSSSA